MRFHRSSRLRLGLSILFGIMMALASFQPGLAQIPIQSVTWDPPMRIPSPDATNSWFPDLAVDSQRTVHVVWSQSPIQTTKQTQATPNPAGESVYYSKWNGSNWSQYVDIVAPSPVIRRSVIAIDGHDTLHLLYGGSDPGQDLRLGYSSAPADKAYSAANWSQPVYLNDVGQSYMSDMAIHQNTIHILYEDTGQLGGVCSGCADIFYRSSPDLGQTWSAPISLDPTPAGSSDPNIFVDQNNVVYASWDEGYDQLSGKGLSQSGVLMYSLDGGNTWSDPMSVTYPNSTNVQFTMAANGLGVVMAVWRTRDPAFPGIYYMWSADGGAHWSLPETLPNFQAPAFTDPYDGYAMAVDSAGHLHLLASGYLIGSDRSTVTPTQQVGAPGLYEFEFDGKNWYPPTLMYRGGLLPERPRLVINQGNQLYATWYVRQNDVNSTTPYQIMYDHGVASSARTAPAPLSALQPTGTAVSSNEIVLNNPLPATLTPGPTPNWPATTPVSASGVFSEWKDYRLLLISLVPVTLLLVGVGIVARKRGP